MVYPHKLWWYFISSELQVAIWYLNVWNKIIIKSTMTCEKQIQAFVSLINAVFETSLRSVLLCLVNMPVLNHIYPRAKWKWKTKKEKLFTYWDCKASSHWVQTLHQFGCQKYSVRAAAHLTTTPHSRGGENWSSEGLIHRVCILGKLLSAALITVRIFIYISRMISSFLCSSVTGLKPSHLLHFPSQKHSVAILMYSCYHKVNPKC